ncbi:hypothetical protein KJ359_011362 [Pestalotiopsis sp. 9143b]|nr:hypothetical protein KJ359_011362 [Pestalotiopsis sp. 9143b]
MSLFNKTDELSKEEALKEMAEYYEAHRPPLELSDSYKTPADLSISTERPLEFYKQLAETCFVDTIRGLETILSHDIKQLADDDSPAQQLQFKRNIDFMFNLVSGQLYDCPRAYNISVKGHLQERLALDSDGKASVKKWIDEDEMTTFLNARWRAMKELDARVNQATFGIPTASGDS